jgi:hypothetical protein
MQRSDLAGMELEHGEMDLHTMHAAFCIYIYIHIHTHCHA